MKPNQLFASLIERTSETNDDPSTAELLGAVQEWLREHINRWSPPIRTLYQLDEYANMELSMYPLECSSLDAAEELSALRRMEPLTQDSFAMWVRDLFWAGTTVESETHCRRCSPSPPMRVLEVVGEGTVVLSCDFCGATQLPDGRRLDSNGSEELRPRRREAHENDVR